MGQGAREGAMNFRWGGRPRAQGPRGPYGADVSISDAPVSAKWKQPPELLTRLESHAFETPFYKSCKSCNIII